MVAALAEMVLYCVLYVVGRKNYILCNVYCVL